MSSFLDRKIHTNRRAWIWTSLFVFVVLGLIDPDGHGLGKVDFPSLLVGLSQVPLAFWRACGDAPGLAIVAELVVVLAFLSLVVIAYASVALVLGWVLHFPLMLVVQSLRRESAVEEASPKPSETDAAARRIISSGVRMTFAAAGAGIAIFAAFATQFNGLQFWFLKWLYDTIHHAATGYCYSWDSLVYDLMILHILCTLNALFAAAMARPVLSGVQRTRVLAIVALGIQVSTLLISTGLWGVYAH